MNGDGIPYDFFKALDCVTKLNGQWEYKRIIQPLNG